MDFSEYWCTMLVISHLLNPYIFVKTDFFGYFFCGPYSPYHDVSESVLLLSWAVLVQKLWMFFENSFEQLASFYVNCSP